MKPTLFLLTALLLAPLVVLHAADAPKPTAKPNIVFIFVDDLGYADIGPFGSTKNRTAHLDRMAQEGMKFTSFYAAPVCSPSRAQAMTGCYAPRVAVPKVLFPGDANGLSPAETTVAKLLKAQGYATMCVGKWHLGDQPEFLPTRHGFDDYFGLPYSNDMPLKPKGSEELTHPLMRGEKVTELVGMSDQDRLTKRYTEEAVKFVTANKTRPFFLYLAHTAVHWPIHPGAAFRGRSKNGLYGDWVEEVDWSTGRILDTLRELKLAEKTLVIFSSDNGPSAVWEELGGEATPLRGAKATTWEGGVRVPTLAWWPGKIAPASVCDAMSGNIDLLPTFVKLAGGTVPPDRKIDGKDIAPLLLGQTRQSPHEAWFHYSGNQLEAVRAGTWKLAMATQKEMVSPLEIGPGALPGVFASLEKPRLYDLVSDIGERTDLAAAHPDKVAELKAVAAKMAAELGNGQPGPDVRAAGVAEKLTALYSADGGWIHIAREELKKRADAKRAKPSETSLAVLPAARAQAPETGAESTGPKPKTSPTPIQFGYRPDGMSMWDPWFVAHEGQVHLFHLQRRTGSNRTDAEADHIGHATSRDLIRWTEQPLTVGPGEKGGMEDMQPWTGCAVVKDGVFHLFYTMRSSREQARTQRIGLATSRDLVNWQRHPGNPVITPDPRWYVHEGKPEPDNKVGCRDIKIVRDPASNGWIGFFTATVPAEEEAEASCIALARSKDLIHWEQFPPAFAPKRYGAVEAQDVFPLGGKWWMTCLTSNGHGNRGGFSDPNVVRGTIVAVADKPEGPYREPGPGYALLGGDLTAGNTVCTVEFEGKRYAMFQEGPRLSPPLELNVTPEGRLRMMWSNRQNAWRGASLLPEILPQPVSIRTHQCGALTAGKWELAVDGSYRGKSRTGWQVADLGFGAADMEVEATVTLKSGVAAGIVLRANRSAPDPQNDFVFALDARDGCVFGASLPMFSPMNRRQFKVEPNHAYHLRLCARGDRYQLYVDGELILHGAFPKEFVRPQPGLGLFVDRGGTVIEKLAVYQQAPSPAKAAKTK